MTRRYWGKRDTKLILPTNSSLSVTLDQDHLRSTTTSRADPTFEKDRLWLNGKEEEIKQGGRMTTCIAEMKRLRKEEVEDKNPNEPKVRSNLSRQNPLILTSPSSRHSPSISARTTISQRQPDWPPPRPDSRPSFPLSQPSTLCPVLHPPYPSSLVRDQDPLVVPSLEDSLHGSKEPYPTDQTPSQSKSHPNPTGPTSTPSSASYPTTRKEHPQPAACNAQSKPPPSSNTASNTSYPPACATSPPPSSPKTSTPSLKSPWQIRTNSMPSRLIPILRFST